MGKKGGGKSKGGASSSASSSGGGGGKSDMKTCNHVKARHILCEKYSKINEAYEELTASSGKIAPSKFGEVAKKYSECSSGNSGGNLGWFPRGKMVGAFEEKAFGTSPGQIAGPFKTPMGYHIILVEGRKM